jgi:hypothetical protein
MLEPAGRFKSDGLRELGQRSKRRACKKCDLPVKILWISYRGRPRGKQAPLQGEKDFSKKSSYHFRVVLYMFTLTRHA